MPAYLLKIAAAATPAGGRRSLSPAIRSRSPIAERDQRLTLTDREWSFEDALGSDILAPDTPTPVEPAPPTERAAPKPTPEATHEERSPANSPIAEVSQERPVPRQPAAKEPAAKPSNIEPPKTEDSTINQSVIEIRPTTREVAAPEQQSRFEAAPAPRKRALDPATKPGEMPARPDQRTTDDPAMQPQRHKLSIPIPVPASLDSEAASIVMNAAPTAREPVPPPRNISQPGSQESSRSTAPPSKTEHPRARRLDPAPAEPSPEPARSGVIIDHLQVEVVSPPAEKPSQKPKASAPARSAPVSQIGPLRGVAKHLAFSIRHR